MSYKDEITNLLSKARKVIEGLRNEPKEKKAPTTVFSEFVINREQGDWAEGIVLRAINETAKDLVAVQYGRSEELVAGEPGFDEFYKSYQAELFRIGKRPDILIFRKEDYKPAWNYDISKMAEEELKVIVPTAIAGLEIRSSSYLVDKYESYQGQKPSASQPRKPNKRKFLSFTPKEEDILHVCRWIQTFNVPHYYLQVFFDRIYGISFKKVMELIANPSNKGKKYFLEKDPKNQRKPTIKIDVSEGLEIGEKMQMPEHKSQMKELKNGRLLFYVTFQGGGACINLENLFNLLGLSEGA
jgi:hypothetical protein